MMKTPMLPLLTFAGLTSLLASGTASSDPPTIGAAMGYCLSKHPYISNTSNRFTADGYEKAGSPGIVGAVRRNYIHGRGTLEVPPETDAGEGQTCEQACRELGKFYGEPSKGRALRQQLSSGDQRTSGIGDLGSLAQIDHDFYLNVKTVAGMWSRANTYHEGPGDVAAVDYCCCQVTYDPAP